MECAAPPSSSPLFHPVLVVVDGLVLVDMGGFQFRKDVQILQGFPSGPSTVPGRSGRVVPVEPLVGCAAAAVDVFVVLLIVAHDTRTEVSSGPVIKLMTPRWRKGTQQLSLVTFNCQAVQIYSNPCAAARI